MFSPTAPLVVLTSACLAGELCGVDGTSNGEYPLARRLLGLENVRAVKYCPEDAAFGTPRRTPDIHGGDGFDVLDGRAQVLSDTGDDWTAGLIHTAAKMCALARAHSVRLALLMDVSAACGSSVIYDGARHLKTYRRGPGVVAAMLMRAGIGDVDRREDERRALRQVRHGGPSIVILIGPQLPGRPERARRASLPLLLRLHHLRESA